MANALEELRDLATTIQCAYVVYDTDYQHAETYILKEGYSQFDLNIFLSNLDFYYDDGFGRQYIYGTIWLKDGTWMDRGEYDGSEWWERHVRPEVPEMLK